jgi:hypothetical protein
LQPSLAPFSFVSFVPFVALHPHFSPRSAKLFLWKIHKIAHFTKTPDPSLANLRAFRFHTES